MARGKTKPLVKRFPPVRRLHWKKKKLLTVLANRRQWQRGFDPAVTAAYEIELENGTDHLVIESSIPSAPTYIITE